MIVETTTFSQIQSALDCIDKNSLKPFKITVLRNITLESIALPLKYFAAKSGYDAQITWGGFDTLIQDASNSDLINDETDLVLIYPHLWMSLPAISQNFCQLSAHQKQQEAEFFILNSERVLTELSHQAPKAHIIWHDFELPVHPSYGIADPYLATGQTTFITELNKQLHQLLTKFSSASYLSGDQVMRRIGATRFYDWRYWFSAKAPYSKETLVELARHAISLFHTQRNAAKKCLVLDCDNTLWGGIVGEDGISGIQLSPDYPGNTFYAFQAAIVELFHRGVLISLCSKNNENDVWAVFQKHPHMLLKKEHIAAARINWNDKSTNLVEIAAELNIGVDSLVFVDDSQFEIEQVRYRLPQVTSMWLDPKQRTNYVNELKSSSWFDIWRQTDEDKLRGKMYQAQKERQVFQQQRSLPDYLSGLNMCLKIKLACEGDIPRVAQQTQKTNQFNLTSKRYNEGQIKRFLESTEYFILTASLEDRFGNMGLVGSAIIHIKNGEEAEIDTFLLSCRALGRKVEYAFLNQVLKVCYERGVKTLLSSRIPTERNIQTADFYLNAGFNRMPGVDTKSQNYFCSDLSKNIAPPFIYIIEENK